MERHEKIRRLAKRAEAINLVRALPRHAQLLHDIFAGENTRKYSPVAAVSVAELARRLGHAGDAFAEQASFYRFFGETEAVLFGTFIVKNIDWENGEAEIGVSLLDSWQGRGLGSALVHKCVAKVFAESTIDRLWATVSHTNEACKRVMRTLGFSDCGLYKESFLVNNVPTPQILYRMHRGRADEPPR